jgi:RNA polymerase sigma factor (sigma-70 family)
MLSHTESSPLSAEPPASPSAGRSFLDEIARRYYAPLLSFFRKRIQHAPEVQDLVQQVFLRLAQQRELGEVRNPEAYLFQTAANTLRDHFRGQARRDRLESDHRTVTAGFARDTAFCPADVLEGRQSIDQVTLALRQMSERTRDILMLRCFEGLKHAEIARLQGISVRAVEKHLAKAVAQLSLMLDRRAGK